MTASADTACSRVAVAAYTGTVSAYNTDLTACNTAVVYNTAGVAGNTAEVAYSTLVPACTTSRSMGSYSKGWSSSGSCSRDLCR